MSHEFHDFHIPVPREAMKSAPKEVLRSGLWARVTRDAIEQLYGPIPDDLPLAEAFEDVEGGIKQAVVHKLASAGGKFRPPLYIDVSDLA